MAANDVLYIKDYYEYDLLRRWAMAYYPKLLIWFYDIMLTPTSWVEEQREYAKRSMFYAKLDYEKIGIFNGDRETGIKNIQEYNKAHGSEMSYDDVSKLFDDVINRYNKTEVDWIKQYKHSVLSVPSEIDNTLKWICPVPVVREYLHEKCNVNPKWEWLYKIFWRGKKYI